MIGFDLVAPVQVQPGQTQSSSHHSNSPGVPGSIPGSHGRTETSASRNHQNLIAHHQRSVSAAAAHHQATHSAVSGVPGSNPAAAPHHHAHQMYPGYPGLPGYNYHR